MKTFIHLSLFFMLISSSLLSPSSLKSSLNSPISLLAILGKEAFAYMAAPLFMPIAIGRAFRSPPGLGPDASPLFRFGRFLLNTAIARNDAERLFRDEFLTLLTKHRRNIMLTMKQFRESERQRNLRKCKKRRMNRG